MTTRRYATITMEVAVDVPDDMTDADTIADRVRDLSLSFNPHGGGVEVYNPDTVDVEVEDEEACPRCGYVSGHQEGCPG